MKKGAKTAGAKGAKKDKPEPELIPAVDYMKWFNE